MELGRQIEQNMIFIVTGEINSKLTGQARGRQEPQKRNHDAGNLHPLAYEIRRNDIIGFRVYLLNLSTQAAQSTRARPLSELRKERVATSQSWLTAPAPYASDLGEGSSRAAEMGRSPH